MDGGVNKKLYKKYKDRFYKEFPKVDKAIIDKCIAEGLHENRHLTWIEHRSEAWIKDEIIKETGAIPISELENEEYYLANHKLYSLSKAKMVYKASPITEYYISEMGNYFAVELIYPDNTGEEPLSKDNIKKIIDMEESDMINTLIQNNEIVLLATEFPEVFHKLELA